jgi:predicted membrane protein
MLWLIHHLARTLCRGDETMTRDRRTESSRRPWWGIALLILGGALLLDSAGAIDLGDLIEVLWPLLLIAWGVKIVRDGSRRRDRSTPSEPGDHLDVARVFGDVRMAARSPAFTGGSVSTTFGDLEIDLSAITLAEGEHVLRLSGVFGDTRLTLPAALAVSVSARTTFGDVEAAGQRREGVSPSIHHESPGYESASRRLRVVASEVFGDVIVR